MFDDMARMRFQKPVSHACPMLERLLVAPSGENLSTELLCLLILGLNFGTDCTIRERTATWLHFWSVVVG